MKKTLTALLMATFATLTVFTLVGCSGTTNQNDNSTSNTDSANNNAEETTLVTDYSKQFTAETLTLSVPSDYTESYNNTTTDEGIKGMYTYTDPQVTGSITISYDILNLGETVEEAKNSFLAIYDDYDDVSVEVVDTKTIEFNGGTAYAYLIQQTTTGGGTSSTWKTFVFADDMHYTIDTSKNIDIQALASTFSLS